MAKPDCQLNYLQGIYQSLCVEKNETEVGSRLNHYLPQSIERLEKK